MIQESIINTAYRLWAPLATVLLLCRESTCLGKMGKGMDVLFPDRTLWGSFYVCRYGPRGLDEPFGSRPCWVGSLGEWPWLIGNQTQMCVESARLL